MRHSLILLLAVGAFACADPKYSCNSDSNCPAGTTCDTAQKLCVIAGGCTQICKTNELCVAAVCVAQTCPTCNANEICDTTTFKCVAVQTGTINLVSPPSVIGGPTASVVARAGAPNGGPTHVDFALKSSAGATIATASASTGDPQGNYTGTLNLSTATTSTGNTLTATVFWKDANGATQQTTTPAATLGIDETPPSITGLTTDKAYYSTIVGGSATVSATITDTGGSSGVQASSVKLTVGSGSPIGGTLQTGNVYQFTVPLAGLSVGSNSFTVTAADMVNNVGTQTGSINVDNTPPTFGALSVPTGFFSATGTPTITAAVSDTGGAGVDPTSVKIKLDATHQLSNDSFSSGTATWNTLTGASFNLPDGQQATVSFTFIAKDNAGNVAESATQGIKIDRKGPAVSTVTAPTTYSACSGNVSVSAVIDDDDAHGGSGAAGATLHVGATDITGSFTSGTTAKTYSFSVPSTVQAANTDTPVPFTVTGTDNVGNATPSASAGTGSLLIDCAKPVVNNIQITGGVAVNGVLWFQQAGSGSVTVIADIFEKGSGVDAASLQLQATNLGNVRIDTGAAPACGAPNGSGVAACTFNVPLSFIASGNQQEYDFVVVGADKVGNPIATGGANGGKIGIDGLAPSLTFNIATYGTGSLPAGASGYYPPPGAGCASGSSVFCGHDGSHFLRKGETNPAVAIVTDTGGSGVTAANVNYSIAGSTNCTVAAPCSVTDAGGGNFSFLPDLSSATFSSGTDGTGTVSITVNAKDAVGNSSTTTFTTLAVTRVKWVRKTSILPIAGAPVYSPSLHSVIVAGTNGSGDPIAAIDTSAGNGGGLQWSAGSGLSPAITSVTSNMALDTTASTDPLHPTPILYVNSSSTLYALHIGSTSIDKYCAQTVTGLTGSPVIFGGGTNAEAIVVGNQQMRSVSTSVAVGGGGCSVDSIFSFGAATHPKLGPPSAKGSTIYVGYDNSANVANDFGIASVSFSGGSGGTFSSPNSTNLTFQPTTNVGPAAISPASDLFFGDDGTHKFYDYLTALTLNHGSSALPSTQHIFAQPIISGGVLFAASNQLLAYSTADLSQAPWTALSGVTQITPPAVGTNTVFLSESAMPQIHAIGTATHTDVWTYAGSGTTSPTTAISGLTTEPTLAADGTLYFGDTNGHVYALITDTAPASTGANDWPRTGYDNCNSNHAGNTGFTCQ